MKIEAAESTESGLCFLADSRKVTIIMRGHKVGEFEWTTRAELAESLRDLAGALETAADYADQARVGYTGHPLYALEGQS